MRLIVVLLLFVSGCLDSTKIVTTDVTSTVKESVGIYADSKGRVSAIKEQEPFYKVTGVFDFMKFSNNESLLK